MKLFFTLCILALVISTPFYVHAAGEGIGSCATIDGFKGLVACAIGFINNIIYIIIGATVVYIVWGAFTMIKSEEKREEGKSIILYGIIGLFVMISIWGLVNILNATFKLDSSPVRPTPFTIPV